MPQVKCKICRKEFYAKPNWLKRGWAKYCSKACQYISQKNGRWVKCHICEKTIYKTSRELKRSISKKYFCSKSCQTTWRNKEVYIGHNHSNWKNGESTYKNILLRSNAPKICKRCGEKDVRVLIIHHLDHNRKNNEIKNLVWLCGNCHILIHRYREERRKFMETLV